MGKRFKCVFSYISPLHGQHIVYKINYLKAILRFAFVFFTLFLAVSSAAQRAPFRTLPTAGDTLPRGGKDSLSFSLADVKYSKDSLDAQVDYGAKDSMHYDIKNRRIHLYGDAFVNYTTISVKAGYIVFDWESNTAFAMAYPDSTGSIAGVPEFKNEDQVFNADSMRYNFKTQKGKVYDVTTTQSDVIVKGSQAKFVTFQQDTSKTNIVYNENAIFTTCTHPEPHFGIRSNRQKVIPDKLVVVGPSNLEIMGVPTPVWLPFGFFPLSKGRQTGLLFPSDYEYSEQWGFGLRQVGWFFPLGDNFNLSLTTDIYLKGTFGVQATSQYRKRYKYNGSFNLGFDSRETENFETGKVSRSNAFRLEWSHNQDRSAHPSVIIGGRINIQTNNFQQRVFNDARNVLQNQLNSNFSFNKIWQDKPISFSASFNHSQNSRTEAINITFPNMQFQTQTLYPFKRKERTGREKWYETITLRYVGEAQNTFKATDSTFLTKKMFEDAQYGVRHSANSGTSFKLFKYFNLNPAIDYREVWYFNSLQREFDPTPTIKIDTIFNADSTEVRFESDTTAFGTVNDIRQFGFKSFRTFSASIGLNTNLFGTIQFRKGWLRGLRHVAKVGTSLSFAPSYLNYIDSVQTDLRFPDQRQAYSIFRDGVYGQPPQSGQQMSFNYGINNIFEAKIRARKDTVDRKIKLIDNLNINGSYNFSADSLKWSQISMNATARFFKGATTITSRVVFDPYILEEKVVGNNRSFVRVNKTAWREEGKLVRFQSAQFNLTTGLTVGKIRALFLGQEEAVVEDLRNQPQQNANKEEDFLSLFENFSINHNFTFGWMPSNQTGKDTFMISYNSLNVQGNIQLTKNWRIGIGNFGYDFLLKDFSYPSISFSRDLHCWEMGMSWQPTRSVYSFFIQVKPGTLGFLRIPYQRNNVDGINAFR